VDRPEWVSGDVDVQRPSVARMYDYFLGGSHNFEVDRQMARKVLDVAPQTVPIARANRAFLRRAVRYCIRAGIRQFLDIGSGIPTAGNVHDVAQQLDPAARVVYVDIDPVAVAHSTAILESNDNATVILADLRDVDAILDHPERKRLLDLAEPVAVLLVSVMHFIPDSDDPAGIVSAFAGAVAPGSLLVFSQASYDVPADADKAAHVKEVYGRTGTQLSPRSRAEITAMLAGWRLVEPGLTSLSEWMPDSPEDIGLDAEQAVFLAGVGRKE
jgi:SAM-dependent methyltransferase